MNSQDNTRQDPKSATSASKAAETARDEVTEAGQDIAGEAKTIKDKGAKLLQDQAERAKDGLADEATSLGSALRKASDELRSGSPEAQLFGKMADSLADFTESVKSRQISEIFGEIGEFGRRNPAAFLGGAALVGFAAVRMVKASQRNPATETARSDSAMASGAQTPERR